MLASLTSLNLLTKILICKHVYRQKETIHGDQIIENEDASFIYDCEKFLHKQFKSFKYKPLINFDGSTECFKYV